MRNILSTQLIGMAGRAKRDLMSAHQRRVQPLNLDRLSNRPPLVLTSTALASIRSSVGALPAESGAVLGGHRASGIVSAVLFDPGADATATTYSPDTTMINRIIRGHWATEGLEFMGFAHSHPPGSRRPSAGDWAYADRILAALPWLDRMAMPIVTSSADSGRFEMSAFHAVRDTSRCRVLAGDLLVAPELTRPAARHPYLERVATAYDPGVMATSRIVAVGVGGSTSFLEDMARSGIGEFVLIDPDVVEARNIGTQHSWPEAIGSPKVHSLALRLAALNPAARVWTAQCHDHDIDDVAFAHMVRGPLPGGATRPPAVPLLCAFTDSFLAQARLSRLALHLGAPFLSAAVYQEGRGVEVAFSAAGVTPACVRCAQASRYRAHVEEGYVNTVTSAGTPLYATSRLNALKQVVALAILHGTSPLADPDHPATVRYGRVLEMISERNLVVTRLDPDLPLPMFGRLSQASDGQSILDDTLWLRQLPDRPDHGFPLCPDCGGTGDLWSARGAFVNTRTMPARFGTGRRTSSTENVPAESRTSSA